MDRLEKIKKIRESGCRVRKLEEHFDKFGDHFDQIDKNDDYVIYRRMVDGYDYYELFVYKVAKPHPLDRNDWDYVELYPGDAAFGVWAWCCKGKDSLDRMLEMHFGKL